MAFGERLTELRKENGYRTRKEFCEKIGIPETTLRNYEKNEREPGHLFIKQMSDFFGVSADYLLGLTDVKDVTNDLMLTKQEETVITKYRFLDERGRATVDFILDAEYDRAQQLKESVEYTADLTKQLQETVEYTTSLVPMRFAGYRAAAGRWVYSDDMETEMILVKQKEGADFIIGVSGDSMEPLYYDGEKVYVQRTSELTFGDVGLFQIGGEFYIKTFAPDGLRSENPKWRTIPQSPDIVVIGRVLDKVVDTKPWQKEKKEKAK